MIGVNYQPTGIQAYEMAFSWLTVVTKCSSEEFVNPDDPADIFILVF